MPNTYKGITFAEGYNKPFSEFKTEFEHTHVFREIPSGERDAALKEAHKIATKHNGNPKSAIAAGQPAQSESDK